MDITDLVLYVVKLVHTATCSIDGKPLSATIAKLHNRMLFGVWIFWIITRIHGFGLIVYACQRGLIHSEFANAMWPTVADYPPQIFIVLSLVSVLMVLQVTWAVIIGRMSVSALMTGTFEDKTFATHSKAKRGKRKDL